MSDESPEDNAKEATGTVPETLPDDILTEDSRESFDNTTAAGHGSFKHGPPDSDNLPGPSREVAITGRQNDFFQHLGSQLGFRSSAQKLQNLEYELQELRVKVAKLSKKESIRSEVEALHDKVEALYQKICKRTPNSDTGVEVKQEICILVEEVKHLRAEVSQHQQVEDQTASVSPRSGIHFSKRDKVVKVEDQEESKASLPLGAKPGTINTGSSTNSGSVKLQGSVNIFKRRKLHKTKLIYKGEKVTAGEPIPVVVKLLNYSENALREAKSLHCIDSHPNVVRIYDSGIHDADLSEYVYIAMESCSVGNLYDYINQLERFNPKQAIDHSTQIISGMKYIHEKGVAHRDIKAHNVLFDADAGYKQIKIVDFGLSKKYLDDPHMTTQPGGTMVTSAPEIIKGIKRDEAKCDIFSLGILLFFVLSKGKHPYGQLRENWSSNIANDKNLDLSGIELPNGEKRDAILRILNWMLQHDPKKRPTTTELFDEWEEKVMDLPDLISDMEKELEENMSTPLSKAELVKKKECKLMGCKVEFEDNSSQQLDLAYVGVTYIKAKTDYVPNEQWGYPISPEVELKIFNSSCEHRATISVPLHELPEENDFQMLQKKNGRTEWELLQVKPALKDRRLATFEVSFVKSVRVLVTCSRIQTTFLQHSLYFNAGTLELLSVLSIDNEVLSTKLNDTLKTHGFNRYENPVTPKNFSHVFELQGQPLKYKYRYIHPTTGYKKFLTKEIIVESDKFMNDPFCCDFFVLRQQESETSAPFVEMTIFSQQDEKVFYVSIWKEEHVGLTNTGYVSVRRSTSSYFDELPKNDVYQMDASKLKGMCLIVNNEFLEKDNARKGSCEDIKMQVALWNDLGFEVTPVINADDMLGKCQQFAALANETCPNIVVVIIMTHGGTDEGKQILQAENGQLISLDKVVSSFTEEKSPHLKGIPKLFMSQACRNTIIGFNVPPPSLSERIKNVVKPQPLKNQLQPVACDIDSDRGGESDILIAYPSQIGKESRGHLDTGSRMMRAVTKVFMENSYNTDVHHMFLKVNDAVSEMGFKIIQRSGQNTSMRKQLYLLPGWPAKQ